MDPDRDITPAALIEAAGLLGNATVPIALVALDGSSLYCNDAWRRLLGDPSTGSWGWLAAASASGRERVRREFSAALHECRSCEVELSVAASDGALSEVVLAVAPMQRGSAAALVLAWDVTERRRNEDRLAFMAGHDALTGLANRRSFEEALDRATHRAARGVCSHVLLLDVDRLKAHNDTRGHAAGDQALVNAALLLRRIVRASDLPARIGGDEFAVLLEDSTGEEARAIAERIRLAASENGLADGGHETGLGFSCGVAALDASADARTVMERADSALYTAKSSGRNRVVEWEAALHQVDAPERIASIVREAFSRDGFHLVYQPVVDLANGSIAYFESLVRLSTPSGRVLMPSEFLPVVERLGMMPRLTRRVVELVLWQIANLPGLDVSVNVSGTDLADTELLHDLEQAIGSSRDARGRFILEIPEATLLAHLANGRDWMETLSAAGCRFVLDDFGTGIGMFVLLREPHVEKVKLSRTVTRALSGEDGRSAFVKALRELIESQGKSAVATYLETERLLGEARHAGFRLAQGYRIGEPQPDLAKLAESLRA